MNRLAVPYYGDHVIAKHYHTPPYLTALPEIGYHVLKPRDRFLVLATDGLFDMLSPSQVVRLVGEHMLGKVFLQPLQLPKRDVTLGEVSQMLSHRRCVLIELIWANEISIIIPHAFLSLSIKLQRWIEKKATGQKWGYTFDTKCIRRH